MASEETGTTNPFRLLPSVDEALRRPGVLALEGRVSRELLAGFTADVIESWRVEIKNRALDAAGVEARMTGGVFEASVEMRVRREEGRGIVPVLNATGVVLHTGLGRSPVHPEVAERMARAAGGYCVLEVDRFTGERNQRDDRLSELLGRLTGAEAGIAVNNNAAAVLLTLQTFAAGRESIVSRGELVEIGGSFRVPDVMARADVTLVEVGTTNRTRGADYEKAITPNTGLLMKVHTSNFRLVGFTEEVEGAELADIGDKHDIPTAFDLGSGLLEAEGARSLDMLGGETLVRDAVASGIGVVSFSGDKLLGGPQAGLLVGKRDVIHALRKNPIYRALRLDKVALAGIEGTLELLLAGRGDEIPARRMLLATAAELEPRARVLARVLDANDALTTDVVKGESEPGSGSAPGIYLDTWVVRVKHARLSVDELGTRMRAGSPPVFSRISEGALVLDPRTLTDAQFELLSEAFGALE